MKYFLQGFTKGQSLYASVHQAQKSLYDDWEKDYPSASWLPVICSNPKEEPPTWKEFMDPIVHKQLLKTSLVASVVVTALVIGVRSLGLLQGWELGAYNYMMRSRPDEGPDDRLLVITVDKKDIDYQDGMKMERTGSLSDEALSQLLAKLESHQPQVVGLDIYRDRGVRSDQKQLVAQLQNPNFYAVCKSSDRTIDNPGVKPPTEVARDNLGFSDVITDEDGVLRRTSG